MLKNNLRIHYGRILKRNDYKYLQKIENLLLDNKNTEKKCKMPLISVCGAPRTGHTLTYQLLVHSFNLFYISNFQYVFYKLPILGFLIKKYLFQSYRSDFKSNYGLVSGLNAPNQAYSFWDYWFDFDRDERSPCPHTDRSQKVINSLNYIYKQNKNPFCSSWLGHCFYLENLHFYFDQVVVIWSKRDLVSTAYSLIKFMSTEGGENKLLLTSSRPKECQDIQMLSNMSIIQRASRQVYFLNKKLHDAFISNNYLIFESKYFDLCNNPEEYLLNFKNFLNNHNIKVKERYALVPHNFVPQKVAYNKDNITLKLVKEFEKLYEGYGSIGCDIC